MAKEERMIPSDRRAGRGGVRSSGPACPLSGIEAAFRRALELSEKDGSIVLSAGSMFVTAEVMTAWDRLAREA